MFRKKYLPTISILLISEAIRNENERVDETNRDRVNFGQKWIFIFRLQSPITGEFVSIMSTKRYFRWNFPTLLYKSCVLISKENFTNFKYFLLYVIRKWLVLIVEILIQEWLKVYKWPSFLVDIKTFENDFKITHKDKTPTFVSVSHI